MPRKMGKNDKLPTEFDDLAIKILALYVKEYA